MPRAEDVPERIGVNVLVSNEATDVGDGNTQYSTRVDLRRVERANGNGRKPA